MILQALDAYYQRLLNDPDQDVAEPGFSKEKLHYELVISREGILEQVNNIQRTGKKGKKLLPRIISVPKGAKRSSTQIAPSFLWDNTGYVLGADNKGKPTRAKQTFEKFKSHHHQILDAVEDAGAQAVLHFLDNWKPESATSIPNWQEMAGQNVLFRLSGETRYLHERPVLKSAWLQVAECNASDIEGFCLASGKRSPIARLHPPIKGVIGAQTSGAALISFNLSAFSSYEKHQNFNAPVSERTAFAYTTALNHMLEPESPQRIQIGDATTVFWSEKPTIIEAFFAAAMGGAVEEKTTDAHDTALITDLRNLLTMLRQGGGKPSWDVAPDTLFYILGLAPNAARISVRFWHASTVEGIMRMLSEHYQDLELEPRYENEPKYPGIFRLLLETVPARKKTDGRIERKADDIQPLLGGELVRAILTGAEYPRSLLSKIIGRFRADGEVTYLRAALLKAQFSRRARLGKPSKEVSVSLDPSNTNVGYRLGRLFAVLEKAQQDALPGINATIKDRFYGAASATPASVFPRLIRMAQHHIGKAEFGTVSDRRMGEILESVPEFPRHMDLDGQAMFALGYYHQRNALWRKKSDNSSNSQEA